MCYQLLFVGGLPEDSNEIDYCYQNYFFTFEDGDRSKILTLQVIDDNVVEPDEKYNLTIRVESLPNRVIIGEHGTTTITIENDDGQ